MSTLRHLPDFPLRLPENLEGLDPSASDQLSLWILDHFKDVICWNLAAVLNNFL
ncbi:hypothetical protein ACPOL_4650 [Acidisarcina polymorpha]|uniref:Uncharacterized protein n=1 Tax=Acidisarcina polymorpha TaxID=2211140 RepID=A0A2Z5G4M4_9BACT|nr:hypothetical protein ACPOL_4650 [Acidisarcina polymorpha]